MKRALILVALLGCQSEPPKAEPPTPTYKVINNTGWHFSSEAARIPDVLDAKLVTHRVIVKWSDGSWSIQNYYYLDERQIDFLDNPAGRDIQELPWHGEHQPELAYIEMSGRFHVSGTSDTILMRFPVAVAKKSGLENVYPPGRVFRVQIDKREDVP